MTDKEIRKDSVEEGNKLIAEFMEWEYDDDTSVFENGSWRIGDGSLVIDLLFDSSWDALMPCVKKWNDLVIQTRSEGNAGWTKWQYKTVMLRTEIEPVWKDLVKSLEWYNSKQNS